jgi:transposase
MEACSSSHHWARWLQGRGIRVSLLPAQYVRAYVRRDKTDRTDAAALLEAVRCGEIRPVCVKSLETHRRPDPARATPTLPHAPAQAAGILEAAKVMCRECDQLRLGVP